MKKIIAIVLLSIFLFNTVGYFIAFQAIQFQIKLEVKSEIREGLTIEQLSEITINKNDLKNAEWFDDGDEMSYKNKRYDIIKSVEHESSITYYCINDKAETELFANLENNICANIVTDKPSKNESTKKIHDQVTKLFFSNQSPISFINNLLLERIKSTDLIYQHPLLETSFPPPKFA